MIKLLWYIYFSCYLLLVSLNRIKLVFLKRIDAKAADEYAYKQVQRISKHVLKKSNTKVNLVGEENIPKETCVFVANHQAIFDAFALTAFVDNVTGFIAKKEIKKIPLISGWLKEIHSVFLDRSSIKEGIKVINEGVENIKRGYSMIIFPEGTRSLASEIGEFKKGSLKLALKANVPIVPVTIDGTYRVLEVGNQVRGHKITIIFHQPIYTNTLTKEEQKDITNLAYGVIKEGLEKIKNNQV